MGTTEFGEEIFKLDRFNMNARKLKESRLMEWFPQHTLTIDFLVTKEAPRAGFPPDTHFEEFLDIFIKCIRDKDGSIAAIAKIYETLEVKEDLKSRFHDFHEGLYQCLDAKPFKDVHKLGKEIRNLSVLGLMDIFIYGEFSHDHPQKSAMFRTIAESRDIREFYWFEFYALIYKSALILFHILLLNESLLKDLRAK